MSLNPMQLRQLSKAVASGDRIGYYDLLESFGDEYAPLAREVVDNSSMKGAVANAFLKLKAAQQYRYLSNQEISQIGIDLMMEDFALRNDPRYGINISVDKIKKYHKSVFKDHGLDEGVWTASIPIKFAGEKANDVWNSMLKDSFWINSASTLASMLGPIFSGSNEGAAWVADASEATATAIGSGNGSNVYGDYRFTHKGTHIIGGSARNDNLMGTDEADVIMTFGGDANTAQGKSGNDIIYGGANTDVLSGGNGSDVIRGRSGNDTLIGGNYISTKANPSEWNDMTRDILQGGIGIDQYYMSGYGHQEGLSASIDLRNEQFLLSCIDKIDIIDDTDGKGQLNVFYTFYEKNSSKYENISASYKSKWRYLGEINGLKTWNADHYVHAQLVFSTDENGKKVSYLFFSSIYPATDVIFAIRNFRSGDFGIHLTGDFPASPGETSGNDVLVGDSGTDRCRMGAGNDKVSGGGGDDDIRGEEGDDDLDGGPGDDSLDGGEGNDTLKGGAGRDDISGGAGADELSGGDGDDSLEGGEGDDTLDGGTGEDKLDGGDDFDTANFNESTEAVAIDLTAQEKNAGAAFGDRFSFIERFNLSRFDDKFEGSSASEFVFAGSGNDQIHAGLGDDWLFGDEGADLLDGGAGWDVLSYAYAGKAITLDRTNPANSSGVASGDVLINIERIVLSNFGDIYIGNGTSEVVNGGDGNDSLFGGDGDDYLEGGSGADALSGGAGFDIAVFETAATGITVDCSDPTRSTGDAAGDTYKGIERFELTRFNDQFVGSANADSVLGGAGDDVLATGDGDDWLSGGAGADVLNGGAGWDVANFAPSTVAVSIDRAAPANSTGDAAGDTYIGIERFILSDFNDSYSGNEDNEFISAEAGDDVIDGKGGDDVLQGGAGSDSFVFARGSGRDIIADFATEPGGDVIELDSRLAGQFSAVREAATQIGSDTVVSFATGDVLTLTGVSLASLTADDFRFV